MRGTLRGLLGLVITVGIVAGCSSEEQPDVAATPSVSPSSAEEESSSAESSPSAGGRLEGLTGAEDYPISMVVPPGLNEVYESGGTRAFSVEGTSGGVLVQDLATLAGRHVTKLPDDLAGYLEGANRGVVVNRVGTSRIDGVPAQSFTLRMTTPSDLWCAKGGTCFKPLASEPMDVLAARVGDGLLWVAVEYSPGDRAAVRKQFDKLVRSIRLG